MTPQDQPTDSALQPDAYAWRYRILLAALTGILFLTFYPFRFSLHASLPAEASPFLLGRGGKGSGPLGAFLNILLFIPFGLGLAAEFRRRGRSWISTILYTWAAGALLSYSIEFAQLYVPARDSGWDDVVTNSTGSLFGSLLLVFPGQSILAVLGRCEKALEEWLNVNRAAALLLGFLVLGFGMSAKWQAETRISNWDANCRLVVGNDATRQHFWAGQASRLQIWDRAIPIALAERITLGGASAANDVPLPVASFDLSGASPRQDPSRLSIELSRISALRPRGVGGPFDVESWLATTVPVTELAAGLRRTNQFSVRAVIIPDTVASTGRILSLSEPSGLSDLYLRQEDTDLVFWFRNGISVKRALLAWIVPNVIAAHRPRDVLFSFDGSVLRLSIDGKRFPEYRLSPGTAWAQWFRYVRPSELNGYEDIYYASLFLPVGVLLGITLRKESSRRAAGMLLTVFGLIIAPLILELILVWVSGRAPSVGSIAQSAFLAIAGLIWINADFWPAARRRAETRAINR